MPAMSETIDRMKTKTIVFIVLAFALAAPAVAADRATDPKVAALARQVNALNGKVTAMNTKLGQLSTRLDTTNADLRTVAAGSVCFFVLGNDTDRVIFNVLRLIVTAITGSDPGGITTPPLDDKGACAAVGVTRTPPSVLRIETGLNGALRGAQASLAVRPSFAKIW
jgi:hypothetical protein